MIRHFACLALIFAASATHAAYCTGTDLRNTLTADEQAEMDRVIEATPYPRGNHWVARKGRQVIHVIATMHLDDPRWSPVLRALQPVVAQADLLFVEMSRAAQDEMQAQLARDPSRLFIMAGPTLPDLLPRNDWQRLSEAMSARGVPAFMAAKMQPWMQAMLLGMPVCALANPGLAERGLDHRLMAAADAAGVPVRSLEGVDELYDLLAGHGIDAQLEMLKAALAVADDSDDHFISTAALYFDEEIAATWAFARVLSHRAPDLSPDDIDAALAAFEARMLDARNLAWMGPILAAPEDRIVVAVGALHLTGETGILYQLEQAGYRLERAPFYATP